MFAKYRLHVADYIVVSVSLLITICIGLYLKFYGNSNKSATDYLLAGRNMSKFPVIFSIVVTMISPISMLSSAMELYFYGSQILVTFISIPIGMLIASYILIPVYHQCGVSTVNEFLEMRFGKYTRTTISIVLFLQMLFYMAGSLFGSVLALSAVTDLSLEMCIIFLGIVCTFYCTLGGLKAVLWTDVYQFGLMVICLLAIYIRGISDGGGLSTIFSRNYEGKRLTTFNYNLSFTERYTIWCSLANGLIYGLACYGTSQIEVQRMLSLSNAKRASSALRLSIIPVLFTYVFSMSTGFLLYSIYYNCDPISNKKQTGLTKSDQVLIYYIISTFNSMPGVTGLCIAGLFSASLSSVSSALNCLSTVTVVDFIQPVMRHRGKRISDRKTVYLAKGLSIFYGGVCIAISFLFLGLESLVVVINVVFNSAYGSILVLFLFGVLTRKGSDRVISVCYILSVILIGWITVGCLYSGYRSPTLPLSTSNCTPSFNTSQFSFEQKNCSITGKCTLSPVQPKTPKKEPFIIFKISYFWLSTLSSLIALVLVSAGIAISGWSNNVIPADSKCLSPITRYWMKKEVLVDKEKMKNDSSNNIMTTNI